MTSYSLNEWIHWEQSDLAAATQARRAAKLPLFDWITAKPQEHGFQIPQDVLGSIMAEALRRAAIYDPDPRGQLTARKAIARWHGGSATAEDVLLTPGTSMAYWYAFQLLAKPGDNVLCPSPTYPLFDDLAKLAHVEVRRYHLRQTSTRWAIDPEEIEFQITPRTRAIVIVSPHNPTGSVASTGELTAVCEIAERRGLAIVFDEVFRDFTHSVDTVPRPGECSAGFALVLNGFSKMFSLPGMKAGWIVAEGADAERRRDFMKALEYVSDCFLPVNEAVQAAIAPALRQLPPFAREHMEEYRIRMRHLIDAFGSAGLRTGSACNHFTSPPERSSSPSAPQACEARVPILIPEAGVYLPIPGFPPGREEELALKLVNEHGILVHPGTLYSMPPGWLLVTCVPRPPYPVEELIAIARATE